jgi:hypothetical protein
MWAQISIFIGETQHIEYLTEMGRGKLTDTRFKLTTFCFDTMLNYHLSQKLKPIGIGKFNHLINTLTKTNQVLMLC